MQQCPVANSRLIDFASREVGKFADSRLSVANFATFGTTLVGRLLLTAIVVELVAAVAWL